METNNLPVDISKLTPEQRTALFEEMKLQEKKEKESVKAQRESYKAMVSDAVDEVFEPLVELSNQIRESKNYVFRTFDTIIQMKGELFGIKDGQQSHTFTNKDATISVKMGYRVSDNYDDTVTAGIEKVKAFISTLAKDQESAALVQTIMDLLKSDQKGNLKASRVLELRKMANRISNEDFSDAIQIIENSYRPVKSCQFIEVKFKDEHGVEHNLPLSISAFDIEEQPIKQKQNDQPTPEEIEEFNKSYIHQGAC